MEAKGPSADFRQRYGPWALIAGGSDGIGAAFARAAAARGLDVALIGRRAKPLEQLAETLRAAHGVATRAIPADLTAPDLLERVDAATADLEVGLLVYNAGSNPGAGHFLDQPLDDARFLVRLSCLGPVQLAHHFGTPMRGRGRGGIVLMSSIAGLAGSGYQATYAATKSFDTTLAEGLWVELAPRGVDVLGVLAGATRTETMLAQRPEAFAQAMDPTEVAEGALDHLGRGPVWVPGTENRDAVRGLWATPRVPRINAMTGAAAALFELPVEPVEGHEIDDD